MNAQEQEAAERPLPTGVQLSHEKMLGRWKYHTGPGFRAEWAIDSKDVVYHFYPPMGVHEFPDRTRTIKRIERAFMKIFPRHADVRAEFLEREAQAVVQVAAMGDQKSDPCDTLYVRAIGWGAQLGVERMAGPRLMHCVEQELMLVV